MATKKIIEENEQEAKFAEVLRQKEAENPENFTNPDENPSKPEIHDEISDAFKARYQHRGEQGIFAVNQDEQSGQIGELSEIHPANDLGYKNIPLEMLPSKGLFYPLDAKVTIRSANVDEIRDWSMIDDGDFIDQVDKLNFILEKCVRVKSGSPFFSSWKDLNEIDRFFIVFRVHELTFPNGENNLMIRFKCSTCGFRTEVPLSSEFMKNFFNLSEDVMKYYDAQKRCFFVHSDKLNTDIKLCMPTVGGMIAVTNHIREVQKNGEDLDKAFTRILPFCIENWRNVTPEALTNLRRGSYNWPRNKFLFVSGLIDKITKCASTDCEYTCERCGEVLKSPLFFRGGYTIKNLFAISDRLDELI